MENKFNKDNTISSKENLKENIQSKISLSKGENNFHKDCIKCLINCSNFILNIMIKNKILNIVLIKTIIHFTTTIPQFINNTFN